MTDFIGEKIYNYMKKDYLYLVIMSHIHQHPTDLLKLTQTPMIIRANSYKDALMKTLVNMNIIPSSFWHSLLYERYTYLSADEEYYNNITNLFYKIADKYGLSHMLIGHSIGYRKRSLTVNKITHLFNSSDLLKTKKQEFFNELFSYPTFTNNFCKAYLMETVDEINIYSFLDIEDHS